MNWIAVSLGFSVSSVLKLFGTAGKGFNTEDTENNEKTWDWNFRVLPRQSE